MPKRPVRLQIFSTPSHLQVVRAATEKVCRDVGFDEEAVTRIVLSIDEALTNVIRHAYGGADDQTIDIELEPIGDGGPGLCVRIRDRGRNVDPGSIRARDLDDVRPGGLGVHIMQQCMDRVEYHREEEGGTLLTMTKSLPSPEREQQR